MVGDSKGQRQAGSSFCWNRGLGLLQWSHYNQVKVSAASHPQHKSYEFEFCPFTFLRKIHKNMFCAQWMQSKPVKAKVGFDEDDPTQTEKRACSTI